MARKATDLLDVFRFNSEDEQGAQKGKTRRQGGSGRESASRKAKSKSSRARASAKKAGPGGALSDGIHLSSRQLLLTSCAALLLLVLSFTLGLATGRPDGGTESPAPALNRQTQVVVRSSLPLVDPASRKQTDAGRIRRTLRTEFDVPDKGLRIWKDRGRLFLQLGPFRDEKQARSYLRRSGLDMAQINMEMPFFAPRFVAYP